MKSQPELHRLHHDAIRLEAALPVDGIPDDRCVSGLIDRVDLGLPERRGQVNRLARGQAFGGCRKCINTTWPTMTRRADSHIVQRTMEAGLIPISQG